MGLTCIASGAIPSMKNLSHALAAASAALMLFAGTAHAGDLEVACAQRLAPTRIEVLPVYAQPVGNYTLSYKELTQRSPMGGNAKTLGLTEGYFKTNIQYGYSGLESPDGGGCSRPSIKITLSFDPLLVYVGKEFPPGTCEFQHIFTHEQRHIQANQAHLAQVASRLQAELTQYYGNRILYGNPKVVGAELTKQINEVWAPRAKAWMELVKETHARIDTPQEYARSATACNGNIQRVLSANR